LKRLKTPNGSIVPALAGCLGLVLLLPASGCSKSSGTNASPPVVKASSESHDPSARASAPDESRDAPEKVQLHFTLKGVDGKPEDLTKFDGQIRVVDFWATWCPPCRVAVPHLNEIHRKYKDRGVTVIGISVDDNSRVVTAFEKESPIEYVSLMSSEDAEQAFGTVVGLPSTYVLDKEGRVYRSYVGAFPPQELEEDLEALLASK